MLQPTVRRTWAPEGQTPIQYSWDRHDRLSGISAISVSPQRRRLGLYFDVWGHNICADDVEPFVGEWLGQFPRGIILVWDRWAVHRAAARWLARRFWRRVQWEWLPPYAPELNPVEGVWDQTKYADLANFIPDDVAHLRRAVRQSLRHSRSEQDLLRSFFKHAKLNL